MASRDEFDPNAEIVARPVEEGFRRFAPLLHFHVAGKVIGTTGEHPFFVYNKGWTKASALQEWDCVLTDDGQWIAVEEVYDTGEWEVVYNLRVAEHHTYFVGDWNWDFSVWAHNTNADCQLDAWILSTNPENVTTPPASQAPSASQTAGEVIRTLPLRPNPTSATAGLLVVDQQSAYRLKSLNSMTLGYHNVATAAARQWLRNQNKMGLATVSNLTHVELDVALLIRKLILQGAVSASTVERFYENNTPCSGCHLIMGQMLPQGVHLQVYWPDERPDTANKPNKYFMLEYVGGSPSPLMSTKIEVDNYQGS